MDLTPLPEHHRPRFSEQLPNMEAGPLIYAFPLQALQRGDIEMLINWNNLDIFQELSLQMGGAWDVQFQAMFFTSFSSILNTIGNIFCTLLLFFRWYICIRNCWLECERLPLVGSFAPRSRTSSLGTCSTPSYTGDHLAPQLFWACWHRWWSDQGADEGIGSAGVRGSEDLRRTSSGGLVSGTLRHTSFSTWRTPSTVSFPV